jgi:hypothetical protein
MFIGCISGKENFCIILGPQLDIEIGEKWLKISADVLKTVTTLHFSEMNSSSKEPDFLYV